MRDEKYQKGKFPEGLDTSSMPDESCKIFAEPPPPDSSCYDFHLQGVPKVTLKKFNFPKILSSKLQKKKKKKSNKIKSMSLGVLEHLKNLRGSGEIFFFRNFSHF